MPGGKGNIKPTDGKVFKKNDPRINRKGRPKKLIGVVNQELEQKGYLEASKHEILSCYLRLINVDIPTLEKLLKARNQPVLVRIVCKNILSGKGFDIIEKMLDRGIGKAEQSLDITSKGNEIKQGLDYSKLSSAALDEIEKAMAESTDKTK